MARATGILPVLVHGQDGHGTWRVAHGACHMARGTGVPPVRIHGPDGHATTHYPLRYTPLPF
jgi:hypothetical protein